MAQSLTPSVVHPAAPSVSALPAVHAPVIDAALAARIEASVALLRRAVNDHGRIVYANSLGAEAIVLTDLICTEVPQIDIVTIDTGRLPEETLALLERLERRYHRAFRIYYPDGAAVERYVREHGINGFYNGLQERLSCCQIRKVEPFKRAIAGYDAWVTGVRREQSEQRASGQAVAHDGQYGLTKISPLLDWSETGIWTYILAKKLPYNPLHDRGYPSIGCAPCSRAIEPGQDHRAGRWWWEQPDSRECGLHPRKRPAATA
ncbi:MAG TPA: phosphoadenylyl-sulfate reductase [Steroidobacteraceae bacterium]|jgi:phosphoadenosine phosphosulfate reductase|nr:phosphoadenylyl-sulfate reductase [Steroidobacteraceae bacterium]